MLQTVKGVIRRFEPDILGYATNVNIEKVLDLVNQQRFQNNLQPLNLSPELSQAATKKAEDMFKLNYWSHVSPKGVTPWSFITSSGYDYIYAGENLAKSFDTSEAIVDAWMNSPTHRANILKKEYADLGIAVMNGKLNGEETTLVVQEFGSRNIADSSKVRTLVSQNLPSTLGQSELVSNKTRVPSISLPKLAISKTISLVLAEFLLIVLFIDSLFIWKYKTMRISSHSIAHIIFILSLIGAMSAAGIGAIL